MPKRHRQPEPLQTSQKQQQKQEQQQERIEDYGDDPQEQVSCSSDEFHSSEMGDDGNVSSTAESLNDDTDSSPMMMGSDNDDDDDDDASLINVDFGVFEMKPRDVDAVMHLMDQLCPDKMNEVDRDELGAVLHASPFTCVVKIGSDDDDDDNDEDDANDEDEGDKDNDNKDGDAEEEEEIYGMASILDVAHESRLGLLLQLLKSDVWRTVAPGILPTDMLTSVDDATGKAKCVLLVGEYIRNVPLELTSHILSDLVGRFEAAFNPKSSADAAATTATALEAAKTTVQATFPCMFALLSKIQRAVDVPVTTATTTTTTTSGATKHEPPQKKKRRQSISQQEEFDMSRYIFWREEDSILYEYRDKRIATVAYRCRPQYDTQPENDLPVSILYVVPYGGLLQAVAEMKKREATQANVVRY
ncbi:hypothetical protein DQ04_00101210 [Trypanosoma grayi]|uniref:hypothetical protein n=1 Tax=Trypanosoma grayi TaxID=71804 RepID=UPI0004F48B8C|nr:hypothetical protein DQ04_00101210 [Trypanosoma grayi]KEG15354.1 hypothetical protein DQ04_00101210 [Trypanosoma grayi]